MGFFTAVCNLVVGLGFLLFAIGVGIFFYGMGAVFLLGIALQNGTCIRIICEAGFVVWTFVWIGIVISFIKGIVEDATEED